jgi:5-methylcytosine-specific restriction endonuclease McrA
MTNSENSDDRNIRVGGFTYDVDSIIAEAALSMPHLATSLAELIIAHTAAASGSFSNGTETLSSDMNLLAEHLECQRDTQKHGDAVPVSTDEYDDVYNYVPRDLDFLLGCAMLSGSKRFILQRVREDSYRPSEVIDGEVVAISGPHPVRVNRTQMAQIMGADRSQVSAAYQSLLRSKVLVAAPGLDDYVVINEDASTWINDRGERLVSDAQIEYGRRTLDPNAPADRPRNNRPARPEIPKALRRAVYERDDYRCVKCGERFDIACDHIIPVVLDGETTLENLRVLCRPCNSAKGGRLETSSNG